MSLASPLPGDEPRAELTRRVRDAATGIDGIARVDVDVRDMDDTEVRALAARLKGIAPPNPLAVTDASRPSEPAPSSLPPRSSVRSFRPRRR